MELTQTAENDPADGSCAALCAGAFLFARTRRGRGTDLNRRWRVRLLGSIGLGSALGGIARYLLGTLIQHRVGSGFPLGTLVINISGSLLLGFLIRYALGTPAIGSDLRAMLTTGFCGGYTTFSSFSYETAALLEEGSYRQASLYVVISVGVALAGIFVGFAIARAVLAFQEGV